MDTAKRKRILLILLGAFLLVMLILTFCSNTVLKRSVPGVDTGNISGGYCDGVFYEKTVPFGALFSDDNSFYIFEIIERDTPLGVRYYLNRVNAVVLCRDYKAKTAGIATAAEINCRILIDTEVEVNDKDIILPNND